MDVGEKGVAYINKVKDVRLSNDEAVSIAMHFINAENWQKSDDALDHEAVIATITDMIEQDFAFEINKDSFNYSRFVSHMHYLLKRKDGNEAIVSENKRLFENMKDEYPKSYECSQHVLQYCEEVLKWHPSEEEQLYLMLHMNRLCAREDCNR